MLCFLSYHIPTIAGGFHDVVKGICWIHHVVWVAKNDTFIWLFYLINLKVFICSSHQLIYHYWKFVFSKIYFYSFLLWLWYFSLAVIDKKSALILESKKWKVEFYIKYRKFHIYSLNLKLWVEFPRLTLQSLKCRSMFRILILREFLNFL